MAATVAVVVVVDIVRSPIETMIMKSRSQFE